MGASAGFVSDGGTMADQCIETITVVMAGFGPHPSPIGFQAA
ncbi:MAG TPA: hypothetical protein VE079_17235 [Ensifer sp.]|nr:hypothetical protein [Ensifer sp.]